MTLRAEYPRPQLTREAWQNLNGRWQFKFDDEKGGRRLNEAFTGQSKFLSHFRRC
jgi:hypothetical protein